MSNSKIINKNINNDVVSVINGIDRRSYFKMPPIYLRVFVLGGVFVHYLCAYYTPLPIKSLEPIRHLALYIFKDQKYLKYLFWSVQIVHVLEALYVSKLLKYKGITDQSAYWKWIVQTGILGVSSIMELNKLPNVM